MLGGLKERERPIVLLRREGHEVAEIARRVASSERTVHRILAGVREQLEAFAIE